MDDHVAVDRPVDPADFDLHSRFHLERSDLPDQEFLARLGVEAKQQHAHEQQEADHNAGNADRDLLPQGPLFPHHDGFGRRVSRRFARLRSGGRGVVLCHQKACPMPI